MTVQRPTRLPVQAIALVLHGGRARGTSTVPPWSVAALRMVPFARSLHGAGNSHGLAVARLRFRVRGWNGSQQSPVADARWALARLREDFPNLPIGLIGHSMGGRTALAVADEESVRSIVALAPWIEHYDPVAPVAGRHLLVLHGAQDRMTDPTASARFVDQAQRIASTATYVEVRKERHAMLRRARLWHELAAAYTLGSLCGVLPPETERKEVTNTVVSALAGERNLVV